MRQGTEHVYSWDVWGFAFYDFANSAYILIFNAFLFPIYYREVVFVNAPRADWYWGLVISCSLLTALVLSPWVGELADRGDRRSVLAWLVLGVSIGLCVVCVLPTDARWAISITFGATNAFYVMSLCIYDSFLPFVSSSKARPVVSGFAWGFGYLGGILCLATIMVWQGGMSPTKTALIIASAFFAIFSALALRWLPATPKLDASYGTVFGKLRSVVRSRIGLLLLAFLLINEGIDIVIFFTSVYGRATLGLTVEKIGAYLLFVQLLAFPGTWFMGWLASKHGERRILNVTFVIWAFLIAGTALSRSATHFFSLAIGLSLVIGSSQALMRSFFTRQFSQTDAGFSFGVYSLVSRATALFGPAIFGGVAALTGSQRIAMWGVLLFFVAGTLIFSRFGERSAVVSP